MTSDVREWTYRHYIANCLKVRAEGKVYTEDLPSLYDIFDPAPVDERSAEEITADVVKKTGITLR